MIFDTIWFIIYDSRIFNEFTYDEQFLPFNLMPSNIIEVNISKSLRDI